MKQDYSQLRTYKTNAYVVLLAVAPTADWLVQTTRVIHLIGIMRADHWMYSISKIE